MSFAAAGLIALAALWISPSVVTTPAAPQDESVERGPDPVAITAPIESWYRLDRKDEHVGYARERIIPVGGKPWSFDYTFELAFIMPLGEDKLAGGRFSVTAQLDDNGEALTLDGFLALNGNGRSFKLTTLTQERLIEVFDGDSVVRIRKSLDDPATPIPSLMLFSAYRTRNLHAQAPLRFIDCWGQEPLMTLAATVSKPEKRAVLGKESTVFDVAVPNLSAVLPELPAFTKFTLDRFGRIVAAEPADGGVRLALVAGEADAVRGDDMLKETNRRDPFIRKRADAPANKIDVYLPPAPRIASVADAVARAEALLKSIRDELLAGRDHNAGGRYADLVALYRELWPKTQGVAQARLERIRVDAEAAWGGVRRVLQRAQALHDTIGDYVEALAIKEAEARLVTLKSLEELPELWRQEERGQISTLIAKASAAIELGRAKVELTSKKLVLTGLVVTDTKTYAVINDKRVAVGDVIEGAVVESISKSFVSVTLRGATRELTFQK